MPRTVKEWIGATPDTPVPARVKVRVFDKHSGVCAVCSRMLFHPTWDCDHTIAIINGGENRESNLRPVCIYPCHRNKTRADLAEKSRVYQVRAAHLGAKRKRRTIRAWRKFNGDRVYAPRER